MKTLYVFNYNIYIYNTCMYFNFKLKKKDDKTVKNIYKKLKIV